MTHREPPQFETRYCADVIEYMALGHSAVAFAGNIGVSRAALDIWANDNAEFAHALAVGRAKAITFWEQKLAEIARSGKGNASAAIFGLKNATAEWQASESKNENDASPQVWSDLELARRIAHILQLAEDSQDNVGNDDGVPLAVADHSAGESASLESKG